MFCSLRWAEFFVTTSSDSSTLGGFHLQRFCFHQSLLVSFSFRSPLSRADEQDLGGERSEHMVVEGDGIPDAITGHLEQPQPQAVNNKQILKYEVVLQW